MQYFHVRLFVLFAATLLATSCGVRPEKETATDAELDAKEHDKAYTDEANAEVGAIPSDFPSIADVVVSDPDWVTMDPPLPLFSGGGGGNFDKQNDCPDCPDQQCCSVFDRPGASTQNFNRGGPEAGLNVISMSPFFNAAAGIGIQLNDHNDTMFTAADEDHSSMNRNSYKIIVGGDASQKPPPPFLGGFINQRGWSLARLHEDGTIDLSFGPIGNGKVYFDPADVIALLSANHSIIIDSKNRIDYTGDTQTSSLASVFAEPANLCTPVGQIGVIQTPNSPTTCSTTYTPVPVTAASCGFMPTFDPNLAVPEPYSQLEVTVGRFLPNGDIDPSFGDDGLFTLPVLSETLYGSNSLGDLALSSAPDNEGNILVAGNTNPDLKGCFFGFAFLLRVIGGDGPNAGTLDRSFNGSGYVVEGTQVADPTAPDETPFTDYTVSPPVNLGYIQYEDVAVHNNGGPLQGYIVAVGDGNESTLTNFWPNQARIIASRYRPDGTLDTGFGVNGRLVISAQSAPLKKQLLARTVAIDENDNIYLGGDIADNDSGAPGSGTIRERPSANFLLIKLNHKGIPQNYGPEPACSSCTTTVFANCSSCSLEWNSGTPGDNISFSAVTTDFKGWDDAIFQIHIDGNFIIAAGQASQDSYVENMIAGFARYNIADGSLDPSFGSEGLAMKAGASVYRTIVRNSIIAPDRRLLAAGQSAFGPMSTSVNLHDETLTNFAVFSLELDECREGISH